jgi:GNAT superfamily N-acetyltransferase
MKDPVIAYRLAHSENDRELARRIHHAAYHDVVVKQFGSWNLELQNKYFQEGWRRVPHKIILLEDEPVGVVSCEEFSDHIFIHEIQLLPEYQGRGIGTQFLKEQIAQALQAGKKIKLKVLRENRAKRLYERMGFKSSKDSDIDTTMVWEGKVKNMDNGVVVKNFVDCPDALPFVAEQLFNQWFSSREGWTLEALLSQMRQGKSDAIPLGLVAFVDGEPAGTVSLLEKDLDECGDLRPWLAGLLVFPKYRERGAARALVEELMRAAKQLGERQVYLWTEIPALYEKFGWQIVPDVAGDKKAVVMRWKAEG